jgi:hypothetical protein
MGPGAPSPIRLMLEPCKYLLSAGAATRAWQIDFSALALYLFSFAVYGGPLLLAIAAVEGSRWMHRTWTSRKLPPNSIFPLFALASLGLYALFLGGGRAFPKYFQTPMISVIVLASMLLSEEEGIVRYILSWPRLALLAVMTAYYAVVVGDYLYTLNYSLRSAAYAGQMQPVLKSMGAQWIFYLLPIAVILSAHFLLKKSIPLRRNLTLVLLGSQIGLCAAQTYGGYDLRQAYGTSGDDFLRLVQTLRAQETSGPVLADFGIVDAAGSNPVLGFGSSSWDDLGNITKFLLEQRPKAVVYGITINTIDQMRAIRSNGRLQSLLSEHYSLRRIGCFWVWLKK